MNPIELVGQVFQWVLSLLTSVKVFTELKKGLDKQIAPDLKIEVQIEEIQKRQEYARNIVIVLVIEATYNIAKSLVLALYFSLMLYWAHKLTERVRLKG